MKEIKTKDCIFCGTGFTPFKTTQRVCSTRCAMGYAQEKEAKKEKAERAKDTKARKVAIMTHKDWLNLLQKVFNTYIRMRDKESDCVSCGTPLKNRKFDAGHYRSVGSSPHLRFSEINVFGQCVPCNRDKHGNLIEYRKRLILKIGVEKVEQIENDDSTGKLSIPEIQEKISYYKNQIKLLK